MRTFTMITDLIGYDADGKDILNFSVVTINGDVVNQNAIVADRIWINNDEIEYID